MQEVCEAFIPSFAYWQYLKDLKALWDCGAQCAVLRKADEVKVERVGQVAL